MTDENSIDELFSDDENVIKKILADMGVDLDEMEQSFRNYEPKRDLFFEVVNTDAILPSYNYPSDSGFDLHSIEEIVIEPYGRALVPTGLKFDIPDGTEIQVRPKSGLSLKMGLTVLNTPGTIDSGYNGEIKVIVFNTTNIEVKIEKGMKVAQAVLCPVINGKWVNLEEVKSIENKERGSNGFGSTGINNNK